MEKCTRSVFFARVPPVVNEDVIERIFATCGEVLDVNLYKPWATSKTSKGCGIVEFKTQEAAEKAITTLNRLDIFPESRAPMLVEQMQVSKGRKRAQTSSAVLLDQVGKLALAEKHTYHGDQLDAYSDRYQCGADSPCSSASGVQVPLPATNEEEREKCARSVYFARVPPTVEADEIQAIFATCGQVVGINLYKPWATSKTSKGCGLVEYATREGAQRALDELHMKYCWVNT